MKIKPCPFCGEKLLEVRELNGGPGIGVDGHYVKCSNMKCFAEGPIGTTKRNAVELWNNRESHEESAIL